MDAIDFGDPLPCAVAPPSDCAWLPHNALTTKVADLTRLTKSLLIFLALDKTQI